MQIGTVAEGRTRALRRAVLRPELAPDAALPGDELATSTNGTAAAHLAATDAAGTVLCTCFVYPATCPWQPVRSNAWRLRQMATAPELRGHGIGGQVVEAAAEYVHRNGGELLWLEAREQATRFYARHGFLGHGAIFTDDQHPIPHLRMSRELRELSGAPSSSTR